MVSKRLLRKFFTQSTLELGKKLLGKFIVRKIAKKIFCGKIVETEVYLGPNDRASHAYKGKRTQRNEAEYLIGGHIYIYLVYGMYWQFNIVTGKKEAPECILIRALEPIWKNSKAQSASWRTNAKQITKRFERSARGPGKLCQWLKLDKSFNKEDLTASKRIWLEDHGVKIKKTEIVATKRIGIDYAGKYWANKKWRFYIRNSSFISKK